MLISEEKNNLLMCDLNKGLLELDFPNMNREFDTKHKKRDKGLVSNSLKFFWSTIAFKIKKNSLEYLTSAKLENNY